MSDVFIAAIIFMVIFALTFRGAPKDMAERRRRRKNHDQTERALASDPALTEEIERIQGLYDELSTLSDMPDVQYGFIGMAVKKLDERIYALYDKNIAEMDKAALYDELAAIEQAIEALKSKISEMQKGNSAR